MKKKRGAPKGNRNARKSTTADVVIAARVDRDRKAQYESMASACGMSLSAWMVSVCDKALRRVEASRQPPRAGS